MFDLDSKFHKPTTEQLLEVAIDSDFDLVGFGHVLYGGVEVWNIEVQIHHFRNSKMNKAREKRNFAFEEVIFNMWERFFFIARVANKWFSPPCENCSCAPEVGLVILVEVVVLGW